LNYWLHSTMLGIPLELWTIVIDYIKKDGSVINIGSVNQYLYYLTLQRKQFIVTETNYEIFFPYKIPFYRIRFNDNFNMDLVNLLLPYKLATLSAADLLKSVNSDELIDIQKKLQVQLFPDSLTHLEFGWGHDQKIEKLPDGLTHLTFGCWFDQEIEKLPDGLTHLTFGYRFTQEIEKLPDGLTHLTWNCNQTKTIEKLPDGLAHLTFGNHFNQEIEKLPNGLTHLKFGYRYNQKMEKLPDTLIVLKIYRKQFDLFSTIPQTTRIKYLD